MPRPTTSSRTSTSAGTAAPKPKPPKHEVSLTIRNLPYTYLHLSLVYARIPSSLSPPTIDILTAHIALQSALSRFLGLHGAAIPVDILHVEIAETAGSGDFWVRVPREDGDKVVAAVAGWVGMGGQVVRVKGRGDWLGGLVVAGRQDVWN